MIMNQEIINATDRHVIPLSMSEVNRIASIHANNGFSMKATASQLGMNLGQFYRFIYEHGTLIMAICNKKRLLGRFRPYGPKKGDKL